MARLRPQLPHDLAVIFDELIPPQYGGDVPGKDGNEQSDHRHARDDEFPAA
jgi:hypothetical protein